MDDLESLKELWASMLLPANKLEKRPTEFLVAETADGKLLGAIGVQIVRRHARLHSEGFFDFAFADQSRHLFLERIQTFASHHGVFRLWIQDASPFWTRSGFKQADEENLSRLPEEWKNFEGQWLTIQLKDEETITAAFEKHLAGSMDSGKKQAARVSEKARTINTIVIVVCFGIFFICIAILIYMITHRR
jgi:N-acetylglutamate synthase-like GNAT family acetyltransferase